MWCINHFERSGQKLILKHVMKNLKPKGNKYGMRVFVTDNTSMLNTVKMCESASEMHRRKIRDIFITFIILLSVNPSFNLYCSKNWDLCPSSTAQPWSEITSYESVWLYPFAKVRAQKLTVSDNYFVILSSDILIQSYVLKAEDESNGKHFAEYS